MALTAGTRLGPYEVLAQIGEGGMGQVYRGTDTTLGRQVAIKILPDAFAADAERVARFEREAKTLASLNHPNIAAIYGFEKSGGTHALVMELVEGDDLSQRIARGAIPIGEALPIAKQIAEALEAAHEQGIIHRDLKPANIKVKPDGTVKVLDFGLAKAMDSPGSSPSVSRSPTIAPLAMTQAGAILGTAAYMSPEQAKGQEVDRSTDVWTFGCVLYEMLTGRAPFTGNSVSEVLSDVLKAEPDWPRLPAATPTNVHRLLRRCLRKDRRTRLRDMGDARLDLDDTDAFVLGLPDRPLHRRVSWTAAATSLAILAVASASWLLVAQRGLRRELAAARPVTRLELNLPAGVELHTIAAPSAVISPDGTRLVFSGTVAGTRRLYVRRFDQNEATSLAGTETANQCFFSPDGSSLAFIASDRTLKTVSLADGLVTVVARGVDRNNGGAWGADGRLTLVRDGVLWQFAPDGASPMQLTTLDSAREEFLQMWPTVIDEGRAVLFTSVTGVGRATMHIEALVPATGQRRTIVDSASYPMVAPTGHLVFFRDGALVAASFDEERLEITGTPVRVADDVALDSLGAPLAAVSDSGALVYVSSKTSASRLVWVSRDGVEAPAFDTPGMYEYPRIGPDGRQITVAASGALWVLGAQRATFGRLTPADSLGSSYGTWTPDGRRVLFRTATGMFVAHTDGTTRPEAIAGTSAADFPNAVSPDGSTLVLTRQTPEMSGDVYALSLREPSSPRALVSTPAYEGGGQWSSDGKWLLYASDESGRFEVYVRPYPSLERRWQVSTQGGTHARWSRDGQEIFFRQGSRMFSVSVSVKPLVSFSQPKLLFDQQYAFGTAISFANYDVAPDGQRFLMIRNESSSGRLNVVLNWAEELKRLVSTR